MKRRAKLLTHAQFIKKKRKEFLREISGNHGLVRDVIARTYGHTWDLRKRVYTHVCTETIVGGINFAMNQLLMA